MQNINFINVTVDGFLLHAQPLLKPWTHVNRVALLTCNQHIIVWITAKFSVYFLEFQN